MSEKIQTIPIAKINIGEYQTRLEIDEERVAELAVSIGRIGLLVPLSVRPVGDTFHIIAGHHRFYACKRIGLTDISCHIHEVAEPEAHEIAIAENLFRQDLTPLETACLVRDIIKEKVMEPAELAAAMGRSVHWISRQLQITAWPDDVLAAIHSKQLSVAAAENVALIPDDNYRAFLLRNAVENGATARSTAAWLQAWRSQIPPDQAVLKEPDPSLPAAMPAVPQAPCIACAGLFRTDALSMVMICPTCCAAIRSAGMQGG